ncbi:MAG: hypothetical protein ACKUBY_03065 [Candidatus Moraniibacteriota bacterium]|jgi:hypothetical protein
MNKNQIIGIIILVAFIFVAIFLYVVFRANKQEVTEDMLNNEGEYTVDINNDVTLDSFLNEDSKNSGDIDIISEISDENAGQQVIVEIIEEKEDMKKPAVVVNEVKTSPQTGPGANAASVALLTSVIISAAIFKTQKSSK